MILKLISLNFFIRLIGSVTELLWHMSNLPYLDFLLVIVCVCLFTDDSFHADKSGHVFVNGMNDTVKLMAQSDDWFVQSCSEQTRYGVLSATFKIMNIKCTFQFGTGVIVRNTDVIKALLDAQPVGMLSERI